MTQIISDNNNMSVEWGIISLIMHKCFVTNRYYYFMVHSKKYNGLVQVSQLYSVVNRGLVMPE